MGLGSAAFMLLIIGTVQSVSSTYKCLYKLSIIDPTCVYICHEYISKGRVGHVIVFQVGLAFGVGRNISSYLGSQITNNYWIRDRIFIVHQQRWLVSSLVAHLNARTLVS